MNLKSPTSSPVRWTKLAARNLDEAEKDRDAVLDRDRQVEEDTEAVIESVKQQMPALLKQCKQGPGGDGSFDVTGDSAALDTQLALRFQVAVSQLQTGLVERDAEVRLLLLAAVCGEHLLLLGPPGTAKSELGRRLNTLVQGQFFERLLTRFSVPEELFGPLSMRSLEADRYERKTVGYLPDASVAFVDEIFKANSAILNSLLTILNERLFDNGTERYEVPLLCMVGASNELPESEELDALYDRFLIRRAVEPVSSENLRDLLNLAGNIGSMDEDSFESAEQVVLDVAELRAIKEKALMTVTVPDRVVDLLIDLRSHLQESCEPPIYVSDRRMVKVVALLRCAAYTSGRFTVSEMDCLLLQHTLWQRPDEAEIIREWVIKRLAQDKGAGQVQYLLTGLFRRTCHAHAEPETCSALKGEVVALRKIVMQQLGEMEVPVGSSRKSGAFSEDGVPQIDSNLWLSEDDCVRVSQTLAPMLKKGRESLEKLLEETLTLELALESKVQPYMLALLMPSYWRAFMKNGPLEDVKPFGLK
ncbi:hypothetical protein CYMTET_44048 [Cymbomonas tetramitiformis]|uniref:AAA+ ATPase domain-containing protein n=1 Tax=Cymbomonas tetramitiformis TaxID=36881 RepID=A0AAE0C328_9CHLO|nr:hypothetical protein CYMTET_44048 [Cymbomonas tetramitiformis]|eukprot:gene3180-4025_t